MRVFTRSFTYLSMVAIAIAIAGAPNVGQAQTDAAYAQLRFEEGRRLFQSGDVEAALEQFRGALQIHPSPNSRYYIARCLHELGRLGEAVAEYLLTVNEATDRAASDPRFGDTAELARGHLEELRGRVGWLTINVDSAPPDLRLTIDERQIPMHALGTSMPVTPGHIDIRIEAEGFLPASERIELAVGERRTVDLNLQRSRDEDAVGADEGGEQSSSRPVGYMVTSGVTFGLAGTSATVLAVFGALALQTFNHLESDCGGMSCPDDEQHWADWNEGRRYQLIANVALGVGAASLVAGVAFLVVSLRLRSEGRGRALVRYRAGRWVVSF